MCDDKFQTRCSNFKLLEKILSVKCFLQVQSQSYKSWERQIHVGTIQGQVTYAWQALLMTWLHFCCVEVSTASLATRLNLARQSSFSGTGWLIRVSKSSSPATGARWKSFISRRSHTFALRATEVAIHRDQTNTSTRYLDEPYTR